MRTNAESKIENLVKRRAVIDAEVHRLKAISRVSKRKQDTRRKILIGAIVLQEMEDRPEFDAWVRKLLDQRLTKPRDRMLFDFGSPTGE
ncbi:MAG: hypothetical protein GC165_01160 [Armatimonadetes bacterium]|nr:hypothetical protein [Armatimonadota bacterium]